MWCDVIILDVGSLVERSVTGSHCGIQPLRRCEYEYIQMKTLLKPHVQFHYRMFSGMLLLLFVKEIFAFLSSVVGSNRKSCPCTREFISMPRLSRLGGGGEGGGGGGLSEY